MNLATCLPSSARSILAVLLTAWVTGPTVCALSAVEPANPKANRAARALLDYFHGLAGRSDHKILSGQFVDFGNGANLKLMEAIHEKTGEWPAMIGVDYADFGRGGITTKIPNQAAIAYGKHQQPSRRLRLP